MTPESSRRAAEPTPVAGGKSHVRPEWVEAAAKAIEALRFTAQAEHFAEAALAAVVPAIQAQALRDAAAHLDKYDAANVDLLTGTVVRSLRARADRIERGELP